MRISHDIRAEAQKEGMAAMAEKFRVGGDLYLPLDSVGTAVEATEAGADQP